MGGEKREAVVRWTWAVVQLNRVSQGYTQFLNHLWHHRGNLQALSLERGPHPLQAACRPLESQSVRKLSLPFFSCVLIFSLKPKLFFYFTSPKIFFMSLGTHHPLSTWGNGGASIDPPLPRPACKVLYAKSAGAAPTRTHITRTWCSYRPPVASVAFLTNTAVENVFPFIGNKCETRWKCFLLSNMDSAYSLRTYLNITLSSSPFQANFQLDYCVVMIDPSFFTPCPWQPLMCFLSLKVLVVLSF